VEYPPRLAAAGRTDCWRARTVSSVLTERRGRMRVEWKAGRAIVGRRSGAQRAVTRSVDAVAESYAIPGHCYQVKTIWSPGNVSDSLSTVFELRYLY
jgi:hypothetical protein